ncbi:MAG: right-handed parallel beta-helix repeat-containing protein [Spirochaetaceae bacterium]|nr:right-handed parallel beta-helix repeat-containing protein [Spirochaetaceae bacterium]
MTRPKSAEVAADEGLLHISLSGSNVNPSLARTMLPLNPDFTRYELVFGAPANLEPYSFQNSSIQLRLPPGDYTITARGYAGDTLSAISEPKAVTVTGGVLTPLDFTLKPYMDPAAVNPVKGVLSYSLGWDGFTQIPDRAELLIETYAGVNGSLLADPEPIPISLIPQELNAASAPGTILLLDRAVALIKLTGALELPPGEYRLTMSVTADAGGQAVRRTDLAHVYSGLTTPAPFFYGSNDILIADTGVDLGPGFITRFNFAETPNATSVVGSVPGVDGTRLIMVIVPSGTDLTDLTPMVEVTPGAVIVSPPPAARSDPPVYNKGEIDFTAPVIWTVTGRNGAVQRYTVAASKAPADECSITGLFFREFPDEAMVAIDQDARSINVVVPYGTKTLYPNYGLTPVFSYIGKQVDEVDGGTATPLDGTALDFEGGLVFRVYAENDSLYKNYAVLVTEALDTEAVITHFAIDGYPDIPFAINQSAGTITAALPYGVSLSNLSPLIQYKGRNIDPESGAAQNFNVPVFYTVTAWNNTNTKTYRVTLSNEQANSNKGIFDFVVTNVPYNKVVIGQNPRADGRIPIVIQVPYGTNETNMIPAITLNSPSSTISPASGSPIPFVNQAAIYTVRAQDNSTQEYVVVVSQDVQYYYVDGAAGSDSWPDIYNGGSASAPFKTLAYAVYKAARHPTIDKIFVSGVLSNATENGAWENAADASAGFHSSGGDSGSVFNLIGTNGKKITVTGVSNATLSGTSNKRVLSVTGGANLAFENFTITGGNSAGNGGGIYIAGDSVVRFSGGSIRGNTAVSGGGVYVEDNTANGHYDFTLIDSTISGNTATGINTGPADGNTTGGTVDGLDGGGGIYVKNYALVWLASGSITGNTATRGSGGGVLINASAQNASGSRGDEYGLLMSNGSISGNISKSSTYPHGGGGVYVAAGVFEMLGGSIVNNTSVRQGGGVFIGHNSRFSASGNSSITGNEGVGSSKAICSRGYTEMMGNAQADKIYIWNNNGIPAFAQQPDSFTLAENARATGIVLAYADDYCNFINIAASAAYGSDQICIIDLEGHLTNGAFKDTNLSGDWLNRALIKGNNANLRAVVNRIPLNTFVGGSTLNLAASYRIEVIGTEGRLVRR